MENHENGGRKPVLMVVVGRQRVGKTSFLNALAQYLLERGAEFAIWDSDQMNTTNNMSVFHAQASSPPSERREDVKAWLEERFLDIAERRYDALLDVGGGDTPLSQLVEDVPVAAALAELGVRVVVVHVLGPDVADLDYLDRFERNLFAPEAVLIVRNSGLVLNGRSDDVAFATLDRHAGLQRAVRKGCGAGVPAALGLHVGSDGPRPELCGGYERQVRGGRESLVDLRQASRPKVVDGRIATNI